MDSSSDLIKLATDGTFDAERESFLAYVGAKPGTIAIHCKYIYWAYVKWKHRLSQKSLIHRRSFFHGFKSRYKSPRPGYYAIEGPFALTKDEEKIMNEYFREMSQEDRKRTKWQRKSKAARKRFLKRIEPLLPEINKEKKRLKKAMEVARKSGEFQRRRLTETLMQVQSQLEKIEREIQRDLRALNEDYFLK